MRNCQQRCLKLRNTLYNMRKMCFTYNGLGKTPAEIYRLIWGIYMDSNELGKRPLSKFTKDVLDELGIK